MEITIDVNDGQSLADIRKSHIQIPNMKIVNLSSEEGWNKIGEYIKEKWFLNDNPKSSEFGRVIRQLSEEEYKKYDCGSVIKGIVKVVGSKILLYYNYKTGEEKRIYAIENNF